MHYLLQTFVPHGQGGVGGRVEGVKHLAHKTIERIDSGDNAEDSVLCLGHTEITALVPK